MATPQDAKEAPAPGGQARASPGRGASPALSPRAADTVDDTLAHESGSAKEDKIIAILDALLSRMKSMETSHIKLDKDELMRGVIECDLFALALGVNFDADTMRIDALEHPE